jgi:hypothetical protein
MSTNDFVIAAFWVGVKSFVGGKITSTLIPPSTLTFEVLPPKTPPCVTISLT